VARADSAQGDIETRHLTESVTDCHGKLLCPEEREIPLNSHSRYSATGKKLFKSFSVRGDRAAVKHGVGFTHALI
jgi:hypothetical protein